MRGIGQLPDWEKENIEDLERFNQLAVGCELRMVDLKQEVYKLSAQLGCEGKYKSVTDDTETIIEHEQWIEEK